MDLGMDLVNKHYENKRSGEKSINVGGVFFPDQKYTEDF